MTKKAVNDYGQPPLFVLLSKYTDAHTAHLDRDGPRDETGWQYVDVEGIYPTRERAKQEAQEINENRREENRQDEDEYLVLAWDDHDCADAITIRYCIVEVPEENIELTIE